MLDQFSKGKFLVLFTLAFAMALVALIWARTASVMGKKPEGQSNIVTQPAGAVAPDDLDLLHESSPVEKEIPERVPDLKPTKPTGES